VFRIDAGSGVPVYRQLVQQVRRLRPGDQLPTITEVVEALAINPNTVVKAYGELEHAGLVVRRQGVGTFVAPGLPARPLAAPPALLSSLLRWARRAKEAGLSSEEIQALVAVVLDEEVVGEADAGSAGGAA
jgi:GntR family transcriptional regulator